MVLNSLALTWYLGGALKKTNCMYLVLAMLHFLDNALSIPC